MSGDELNLRVDALTSQTRRFKGLVGEFLRLEFKRAAPESAGYEVSIRIERPRDARDSDVDSVAKSVLEALTGVIFHEFSLVERLVVSKHDGDHPRVTVIARPLPQPPQPVIAPPLAVRKRMLEPA